MPSKKTLEFNRLIKIVARLRALDGCPWDKQQTHASLREFLLQETYEVLEALDEGESKKLCQELGDLLLQIVLHARIAEETEEFKLEEVIQNINEKLVRRHPHIFGEVKVTGSDEVEHNWEAIKRTERDPGASALGSVPRSLPALSYSQDVQRRAAQSGFDWPNLEGVIDKLTEEVRELQGSITQAEKEEEFGDLFFTLVNIARRMGVDSESALRLANNKFYNRYRFMETLCRQRGLDLAQLSFDEQNKLWDLAKKGTRKGAEGL